MRSCLPCSLELDVPRNAPGCRLPAIQGGAPSKLCRMLSRRELWTPSSPLRCAKPSVQTIPRSSSTCAVPTPTGERAMDTITLYGFQRSTYVNVARLVLTAKGVPFLFHDTEAGVYGEGHARRHPFGRVPVLQHGGFWLYETSAIALYVDEAFAGPCLQPVEARKRAKMHQWISSLGAYYYPYIVFYLVHERVVFPELGIAADEAVVAAALPRIERALDPRQDRKSTRLNSSHRCISYAV